MMVAEFQASLVPPHVNARSNMKMDGMKKKHPIRSSRRSLSVTLCARTVDGGLKKTSMMASVNAPGGRLIQKHHRHVIFSVKTPPRTGARIKPKAKKLLMIPMNSGFTFSEEIVRTTVKPPLPTPEAPIPAMARPTINVSLFGAQPHMMLPTRKMVKKTMYTQRRVNTVVSFPASGVSAHVVNE